MMDLRDQRIMAADAAGDGKRVGIDDRLQVVEPRGEPAGIRHERRLRRNVSPVDQLEEAPTVERLDLLGRQRLVDLCEIGFPQATPAVGRTEIIVIIERVAHVVVEKAELPGKVVRPAQHVAADDDAAADPRADGEHDTDTAMTERPRRVLTERAALAVVIDRDGNGQALRHRKAERIVVEIWQSAAATDRARRVEGIDRAGHADTHGDRRLVEGAGALDDHLDQFLGPRESSRKVAVFLELQPLVEKPPLGAGTTDIECKDRAHDRSSPLVAMTFLYQPKLFFLERLRVPLPASSRST